MHEKELEQLLKKKALGFLEFSAHSPQMDYIAYRFLKCLKEDNKSDRHYAYDPRVYNAMKYELSHDNFVMTQKIMDGVAPSYRLYVAEDDEQNLWEAAAKNGNLHGLRVLDQYDVEGSERALLCAVRNGQPGAALYLLSRIAYPMDEIVKVLEAIGARGSDLISTEKLLVLTLFELIKEVPEWFQQPELTHYIRKIGRNQFSPAVQMLLNWAVDSSRSLPNNRSIMKLLDHVTVENAEVAAALMYDFWCEECRRRSLLAEGEEYTFGVLDMKDIDQHSGSKTDWGKQNRSGWEKGRDLMSSPRALKLTMALIEATDEKAMLIDISRLHAILDNPIPYPFEVFLYIVEGVF